jgi:hypothetical protein
MGLLWEAYQQISNRQIDDAQSAAQTTLAERVLNLEEVVVQQGELLGTLIQRLEQRLGEDLNGDAQIG